MNSGQTWSADEMMTVAAARGLADGWACFVGIGLPSTAANLARRLHAPSLVLIYESGPIGAKPETLPLSIGEVRQSPRTFVDRLDSVTSVGYGSGRGDRERWELRTATEVATTEPPPTRSLRCSAR